MEFLDAEYAAGAGAGRPTGPNPYRHIIAQIALKLDAKGKPVAKAVVLDHSSDDEDRKKTINAQKRLLSVAGHLNEPAVSTGSKATPYVTGGSKDKPIVHPGKTLLTFWTIPLQTRPRKPVATTVEPTVDGEAAN